jgi:CheY-like chemotaxis protein
MPTQSALELVDAVSLEARSLDDALSAYALRAQAAYVRALVDEVERHHPADPRVASLHQQLGEELARLAELIPVESSAQPPASETHVPVEALQIDVLVVDDEDDGRHATVLAVNALGYACRSARSGEDALRVYAEKPAAIVLSDWSMPGMSGLELCMALKRREPKAYVMLATAFHDKARLLDGERAGTDDFLTKPLDLNELEARLAAASRLVRAVRALADLKQRLVAAHAQPASPEGTKQT